MTFSAQVSEKCILYQQCLKIVLLMVSELWYNKCISAPSLITQPISGEAWLPLRNGVEVFACKLKMKTIPIQISNEDYGWLSVQAEQREMTIAQIIEEMVRDASESAEKETEYLLSDPKMRDRLLKSGKSAKGIPYEAVREKLRV